MSNLSCAYTDILRKRGPKSSSPLRAPTNEESVSAYPKLFMPASDQSPICPSIESLGEAHSVPLEASPSTGTIVEGDRNELSSSSLLNCLRPLAASAESVGEAAQSICKSLQSSLRSALPGIPLEELVEACISIHLQYFFPVSPICHENTLRCHASLTLWPAISANNSSSPRTEESGESDVSISSMRAFTLVTALCGTVSYITPSSIFAHGTVLAPLFYQASKEMLKLYEEYDIEHPDSGSVAVRMFHSACLHHNGKTRSSWHLLNQARLLAQDLAPSDNHSANKLDAIESLTLQNCFWLSLTATRSAIILGDHQITQYNALLDYGQEPCFPHAQKGHLLDKNKKFNSGPFEERLSKGFDLCRRLWASAYGLIFDVEVSASNLQGTALHADQKKSAVELMESWLNFTSIVDGLPPWLQRPDFIDSDDPEVAQYQSACFWSQRTDILVSFHSLRLIILRRCIDRKMPSILGLSDDPLVLAIRKLEISQEFVGLIEGVPFRNLKMNGEPCVSNHDTHLLSSFVLLY